MRNVPFTGLEWSFYFRDSGFDCNGKKLKADEEDNEAQTGNEVEMSQLSHEAYKT